MYHLDDIFVTKASPVTEGDHSAERNEGENLSVSTDAKVLIDPLNTAHLYCWLFVIGGISGFIYEILFYRIDLGYFVKRGSTFGPWIPIYGFGAIFIYLFANHFRNNPIIVFLLNCLVTGILEFATGWFFHHFFDLRLWDYNVEIWNWGNIGGYICLRSVLLFGIAGLLAIYSIAPTVKKISAAKWAKISVILSCVLAGAFVIDIILWHFFGQ